MRKLFFALAALQLFISANAQTKRPALTGMYVQWGYNREWYTSSTIQFKMHNGNNFKLIHAKAHDKPDFDAIIKEPGQVSIPQYNYRLGFYLNQKHTRALEVNFDHIKYVVTDGQKVRVSGNIDGVKIDADSILNPATFLHLEHTDGGNLFHFNYVQQNTLLQTRDKERQLLTVLWKAGLGFNVPRTDFTWRGDRFNNAFHIAGYNISAEAGLRMYPLRKLFVEFTGKAGYVHYINALANTVKLKGNRVSHGFGYFETIGLIGYDINF